MHVLCVLPTITLSESQRPLNGLLILEPYSLIQHRQSRPANMGGKLVDLRQGVEVTVTSDGFRDDTQDVCGARRWNLYKKLSDGARHGSWYRLTSRSFSCGTASSRSSRKAALIMARSRSGASGGGGCCWCAGGRRRYRKRFGGEFRATTGRHVDNVAAFPSGENLNVAMQRRRG